MELTKIPMPRPRNPQVDMKTFLRLVERVEELERKAKAKPGRPPKEDKNDPDQ